MKKVFALCCGLFILSGCASLHHNEQDTPDAEELYRQGYHYLQKTSYAQAAEYFEKVELEHPYSKWAVKAKLMSAYAYYKDEKYDDALLSLDRFTKFHPGNKDIAYAYYMKGLCYYNQISPAEKEQDNTQKADSALRYVVTMFPETPYAQDAESKLNLISDHKAGHEMTIGRYYLKGKNYLSALNRFNVVVTEYQTTPQIEEALYRQVEIYTILGLNRQARQAASVLKHNYPSGSWTQKALNILNL